MEGYFFHLPFLARAFLPFPLNLSTFRWGVKVSGLFFRPPLRLVGVAVLLASPIHHTLLAGGRQGNFGVGIKNFKCWLFYVI